MMKNLNLISGKSKLVNSFFAVAWFALRLSGYGASNPAQSAASAPSAAPVQHVYPSGVEVAVSIGSDLYNSLDKKYRSKLQEPPICVVPGNAPEMAPVANTAEDKTMGQLSVSVGFVNLINHIAHALAVDRIQPGYFNQYMTYLATPTADGTTPEPPDILADRCWTDDVMNDQASYFNQMMGMTMAINLSHHYLGEFNKYAGQAQPGKPVVINNYVTSSEWDTEIRAAVENSLDCAYATEGVKALFSAIDKMPHRPAWTAYVVPQNIDIQRLNKRLAKYEVAFFHGGLN